MKSEKEEITQKNNSIIQSAQQDFPIIVQASKIRSFRTRLLSKNAVKGLPLPELLLTLSSIAFGGIIGALQAGITHFSDSWWIFYVLLPVIAVGSGVAFWFLRIEDENRKKFDVQAVLNELPNPDETPNSLAGISNLVGTWRLKSTTAHSQKTAEGILTVSANIGRLSISGHMTGESSRLIADITSLSCDYDPDKRQLIATYRVFATDDNGLIHVSECAISGILVGMDSDNRDKLTIKGHWFSLFGEPDAGRMELSKIAAT